MEKCSTLGFFIINFKYIIALNLIILCKDNIIYALLSNTIMYLNLIEKLDIQHLKNWI